MRGVFHCYSGSAEDAKTLVKLGWHLSFTGTITFKNARKALEVIAAVPLERIMVETDAPYMAPTPSGASGATPGTSTAWRRPSRTSRASPARKWRKPPRQPGGNSFGIPTGRPKPNL